MAPPPTAQTAGSIWLIFWLRVPSGTLFKLTVAIFDFPPPARDIGGKVVTWWRRQRVKKWSNFFFLISDFFQRIHVIQSLNYLETCYLIPFDPILKKKWTLFTLSFFYFLTFMIKEGKKNKNRRFSPEIGWSRIKKTWFWIV